MYVIKLNLEEDLVSKGYGTLFFRRKKIMNIEPPIFCRVGFVLFSCYPVILPQINSRNSWNKGV